MDEICGLDVLRVLAELDDVGGASIDSVAFEFGVRTGALTVLLERLEAAGLIRTARRSRTGEVRYRLSAGGWEELRRADAQSA
jgi:DNA-binding PadR family transcriptional regulator